MPLNDKQEQHFSICMGTCGYDTEKPRDDADQQLINVARCMYQAQQDVIDSLHYKIDHYLQAGIELARSVDDV